MRALARAFTLIELLIVLVVVASLFAGLSIPFATQVQMRRHDETRRLLDEARESLLGFASVHARLPCPASAGSRGHESFAPDAGALDGRCSNALDGFLPAATLGLSPLDEEGFFRDAWATASHRIRYAVFAGPAVNGVEQPFTRTHGMRSATLAELGAAPHFLLLCVTGAAVGPSTCGPASNHLTRRAVFVVHSTGANGASPPRAGSDEALNLDGDPVFVTRDPASRTGEAFDDLLTWVSLSALASRLIAAGVLP